MTDAEVCEMSNKNNIILIGMPGCGKSTVGVVLAKTLGYRFMDSDLVIQEKDGRLLSKIIEQEGIDGFNKIENEVNASIDVKNTVVATGGSVVYGREAMRHLSDIGTVVYIRLPYKIIRKRLGDLKKRGVSIREGQTLRGLYDERSVLYEHYADIIIDPVGKNIPETVKLIKKKLKEVRENDNGKGKSPDKGNSKTDISRKGKA